MTSQQISAAITLTNSSLRKWRKKWIADGCPHWRNDRMYYIGLNLDHFLDLLLIYKSKVPQEIIVQQQSPTNDPDTSLV